jgi:acyl carrier protein
MEISGGCFLLFWVVMISLKTTADIAHDANLIIKCLGNEMLSDQDELIECAFVLDKMLFVKFHGLFELMSLEEIFANVFSIPQSTVVDALALEDIPSWDSMTHMLLIVRLEETYQMQFTGNEIADIRTVADTRAVLLARGATL